VHWVKIDASTDTLLAQGNITGPGGAAAFNPSIAVDANGDVAINYTVSSSSMDPAAYVSVMPAGASSFLAPVQYASSVAPEAATFGVTNNVIRWGDYSTAVADPASANGFVVSNEIVPSAQSIFNNAPWGTVTADITLSPGTSAAVVTSSSTTTSSTSSGTIDTSSIALAPLTAATGTDRGGLSANVASLDATNLPSFAPLIGGGHRDGDPHFGASLGLLVNYMAFAFASGGGDMGGSVIGQTTDTQTLPLASSHA
jgi:hypothetical protein